jgi:hypothetical protein
MISASDLQTQGRDPSKYARWPEYLGNGDMYIGKSEMVHQLHCLVGPFFFFLTFHPL